MLGNIPTFINVIFSQYLILLFRFAHAFLVDTGSGVGQMMGHAKLVNTVDYKQTRPFRVITASEDFTCGFYEGPPFKLKFGNKVLIKNFKPTLTAWYR